MELRELRKYRNILSMMRLAEGDELAILKNKKRKIEKSVESVENVEIRVLLRRHYLEGLSWYKLAIKSGKTPDALKKSVSRYFKNYKNVTCVPE